MKKTVISSLLCTLLISCTLTNQNQLQSKNSVNSNTQAKQSTKPNFDFAITGGQNWGLVQAFTSKGKTYVQFMDISRVNPMFLSPTGDDIAHTVNGMYAVLDGEFNDFIVVSEFGRAVVYKIGLPTAYVNELKEITKIALTKPAKEDLVITDISVPVKADITPEGFTSLRDFAKQQQSELLTFNENNVTGKSSGIDGRLKSFDSILNKNDQVIVHVYFDDMATEFTPNEEMATALISGAKLSNMVLIRGFTDATKNTLIAKNLAFNRAVNVKKYLIANGLSKTKVKVTQQAAGGFIAKNNDEGKALNRRADVYFSINQIENKSQNNI